MDRKEQEEKLPTLEIDPSTAYRERPLWHRIVAFVLIALIVVATAACAFWKYLG